MNKILVFRFGQIGDTVAALPSLWVLRKQFPQANIVLLNEIPISQKHLPPDVVLPVTGLVDGFEQYPAGASLKNIPRAWRQIRGVAKQGFDTLVYLVPSARAPQQRRRDRLFFKLCGIKKLLAGEGFPAEFFPRLSGGGLSPLPKEADALLARLKQDGFEVPPSGAGCMDLMLSNAERAQANRWWNQQGLAAIPKRWIAICLSGKTTTQLWPVERYVELVGRLIREHGVFPVVVGGPQDRDLGLSAIRQWNRGLCSAGDLTVRESAALMESAAFYLGNDTGVMHLAAAVGIPCVAVFSARNQPGIWEPYGQGHKVLRYDPPCAGCRLSVCNRNLECLTNISVEQVFRACEEVLARGTRPGNAEKLKS